MTPERLVPLVARALTRPGTTAELDDWAGVLQHTRDDDADQALQLHRATSPHTPTPADVRRLAIGIANDRASREATARRRREVETGIAQEGDHAGQPLRPMPPQIRDGLRRLAQRHHVPDTYTDDEQAMAAVRADLANRTPLPTPEETS